MVNKIQKRTKRVKQQTTKNLLGLTDDFARQLLLYGLCRDHYHVGPVHDPTLFPDSVPSCAVLVAVILHHFSWESNNTAAHDTESKVEELYATSAKRFVREYKEHCRRKQVTLAFVLDSYRSGFPLPSVVLAHLHENCIDFDWTAMPFQLLIVHQLLHDEITQKYPPSLERMTLYLKTLTDAIEFNNQEVQEELLLKRCQCTESLLRSSHSPSTLPSGYTTLKYGTNEKDIITLLMNSGINNNDGLTAWKAGYLMAEFILHQPHIFEVSKITLCSTHLLKFKLISNFLANTSSVARVSAVWSWAVARVSQALFWLATRSPLLCCSPITTT